MKGNRREREAGGRTLMKMNKLIVFATVGFAAVAGFAAEQSDARGKSAAEAYRTVRDESEQLVENLSAAAEELESLHATYEQSVTSLLGLAEAMDDVSAKLLVVSGAILETGSRFSEYGKIESRLFWAC